jgi:RNA polymerase sigma-70 factor (ECF subfamily)
VAARPRRHPGLDAGTGLGCRGSRLLPTEANGGGAFAQYRPDGRRGYHPWALQVLETNGGLITGLHCYVFPELFTYFGFPASL